MGRPGTPETGRRNAEREITLLPMHLGVPKTQRYICLPRLLFCIIRETIKAPPWQDCFEAKMKLCMERASYIACYSFTHFINCHALLWARHCARHRRSTQQMASRVSVFVILIGLGEPSILTSGSSDCGRQMQRDPSFLLSLHPSQFPDLLFGIPPPGIHHPKTFLDHKGGEHCGQLRPTPVLWESAPRTWPLLPRIAPGAVGVVHKSQRRPQASSAALLRNRMQGLHKLPCALSPKKGLFVLSSVLSVNSY